MSFEPEARSDYQRFTSTRFFCLPNRLLGCRATSCGLLGKGRWRKKMNKKTSAIVVVLALSGVALAPVAAAHLTATGGLWIKDDLAMDGTEDGCRSQGSPTVAGVLACGQTVGMSGTYRGSAGVHVSSDQFPLPVGSLALVCVGRATTSLGPANRFCEVSTQPSCDFEWLIDGLFAGNEKKVENGSLPSGGELPDGLWDDGGIFGALCHTSNGPAGWQTLGCGAEDEEAFAEDANPLINNRPWISNECDYLLPILIVDEGNQWFDCVVNEGVLGSNGVSGLVGGLLPGGDGEPDVEDVAAFLVNDCAPMLQELVLSFAPDSDDFPAPGELEGFVENLIEDLMTPPDDTPADPFTACGSDAGPDVANYGYGMGSQAMAGTGVANIVIGSAHWLNGDRPTCSPNDANQWGFVRDYVNVNLGSSGGQVKVGVSSGWYDVA
jgi:hypothetical protein